MKTIKNAFRIVRLLLNGWSVRFSYVKKFPANKGNTVSTLCYTIASAELHDRLGRGDGSPPGADNHNHWDGGLK